MRQWMLCLGLVACGKPAVDGLGDVADEAEEEGFYEFIKED